MVYQINNKGKILGSLGLYVSKFLKNFIVENLNFFSTINSFHFTTFCDECIDNKILFLQAFCANKTVIISRISLDISNHKV